MLYGDMLAILGRVDESERQVLRALELDPNNLLFQALHGYQLAQWGRIDDGIAQYQKVLRMNPNSGVAHTNLSPLPARKQMYAQAFAEEKVSNGQDKEILDALERGYAQGGFREANRLAAQQLEMRAAQQSRPNIHAEALLRFLISRRLKIGILTRNTLSAVRCSFYVVLITCKADH